LPWATGVSQERWLALQLALWRRLAQQLRQVGRLRVAGQTGQ
jgi:hypothetical protein